MYKVIVVDDEPLILRSIKKSIENAHTGFQIVGEALNGEDAIPIIEKAMPDVIFTDIRMPVVDGLALIDELRNRSIQSKVVILSGYQEFDYAKRALKFDVEEYLLKPISQDELKKLLNKMYDDLEDLKSKNQYRLLESISYNDINSFPPSSETKKYFEGYNFFGTILICAGSYCTFSCNWITPAKDFWFRTDLNLLLENTLPTQYKCWTLDFNNGNEKLVLLGCRSGSLDSYTQIHKQIYNNLLQYHFPITLIAGEAVTSIDDLPYIVQHCKITLNKSVIFGSSRQVTLNVQNDCIQNTDSLIDTTSRKFFSIFIEKNQPVQFKSTFKKLLDSYNDNQAPQLTLSSMLKHVVHMFRTSNNRMLEIEMEIDELISNSFRYQSIYEGMSIIFDDLFNLAKDQFIGKNDQKTLIDNVENYIRQNYSQQISLQSIAEKFSLVLPYLSSIFKKSKGISPMEFMINLKIEKAKELLLMNPPLTLKDISISIGYDDPYYMSRIFKSVTGKSPTEYRNRR